MKDDDMKGGSDYLGDRQSENNMTDNPITLQTGQTATLEEGIMRVTDSAPAAPAHHYKMTAQHKGGGLLDVRTAEIDDAMAFLKQLLPLGYELRNIVRMSG